MGGTDVTEVSMLGEKRKDFHERSILPSFRDPRRKGLHMN